MTYNFKIIVAGAIAITVTLGVAAVSYSFNSQNPRAKLSPTMPTSSPAMVEKVAVSYITHAELRTHNSISSCYTVIRGDVYDLTSFAREHPGGESAIASLCGTDGTAAFTQQHEGDRRPMNELARHRIGKIAP